MSERSYHGATSRSSVLPSLLTTNFHCHVDVVAGVGAVHAAACVRLARVVDLVVDDDVADGRCGVARYELVVDVIGRTAEVRWGFPWQLARKV